MIKWFNTAGPCKADIHYMLPPLARLPQLDRLIEQQGYFVIHAPRQTGKTTAMMALAQQLTASGKYTAAMVSAEVGAAFPHDLGAVEAAMLGSWRDSAEDRLPTDLYPLAWPNANPGQRLQAALRVWAKASSRPLVVFIDEIDALQDETLISVLRQLRSGYPNRPQGFLHSLALIGVRDARDLVLMAFLHRVVNGGGVLEREYAIGSDRMDLCLRYGEVTLGMELKVWREGCPDPIRAGLEQLDRYLAGLGLNTGWLVVFDQRQGLPPIAERLTTEQAKTPSDRTIIVIRG